MTKRNKLKNIDNTKTVIIIGGVTCSGKSQLAIDLARAVNGEIINADSMQVYKELPIITAQPMEDDKKLFPHHLYGFLPCDEVFTVASYIELVKEKIEKIYEKEKTPIFVGGTGFYISALLNGINQIPDTNPSIRQDVRNEYEEIGIEAFYNKLCALDPQTCTYINKNDKQRMMRSMEVLKSSGKPINYWWKNAKKPIFEGFNVKTIALIPEKDILNLYLRQRIDKMIDCGLLEEVSEFNKLYPSLKNSSAKAIGLQDLLDYVSGKTSIDIAIEKMLVSTRQYAKRQSTWFRNQLKEKALFLNEIYLEQTEILQKIQEFIL